MVPSKRVHVAVGVIQHPNGDIYLSQRHAELHQGGKWEFPGGKVEPGETVYQALCRELAEECQIRVEQALPLTAISHDYGDKQVLLDVWLVTAFSGEIGHAEGQRWCWVAPEHLPAYEFPQANQAIVELLLARAQSS